MKKILFASILLTIFLLVARPIFAEDEASSSSARKAMQEKRQELRSEMQDKRQAMMEEMKTKREAFQDRLKEFKDARKEKVLERVEKNLNSLNTKIVAHLKRKLEVASKLVDKMESRAAKLKEKGADVTIIEQEIAALKTEIAALQTKVAAQGEKTYTPDEVTEDTARSEVAQLHAQLKADIQVLRTDFESLKTHMKAVIKLLQEATASLENEATPSAEPTI